MSSAPLRRYAPLRLYAAVGLGSGIGAVARFLCALALPAAAGPGFPWATLLVNVLGSFLIGLYASLAGPGGRLVPGATARQFVVAGLCGGFTTFSIFSLEALQLVAAGRAGPAATYVAISVVLWVIAAWAGHSVGHFVTGRLDHHRR